MFKEFSLGGGLSTEVEQQRYTLEKNLRGDPPYSQILIGFLLSEENFLPWYENNNASEEALSNRC